MNLTLLNYFWQHVCVDACMSVCLVCFDRRGRRVSFVFTLIIFCLLVAFLRGTSMHVMRLVLYL